MYTIEYLKKKLHTNGNIKLTEVRLTKRLINKEEYDPLLIYNFGSVWSIPDAKIKFGNERRNIKDANRPVVLLSKVNQFNAKSEIEVAPGTSLYHRPSETILVAKVPPERLRNTTYFLLHHRQTISIRSLRKKLPDLSYSLINELKKILDKTNATNEG
ncbi:hypothetical protein [Melioribacter sp. OK-6-Me]|uniref:hypothetical protein n=1 Tax=unclassified Melioribacter TaxID=2627329 RepID=UPI003ED8508A